ncbi:hypothetical protein [Halomicrobium urmianum]|uniref:hypothetical protein n=1 Tax=Halomicrobium urmianum TaxID=1586233 RepID=UPI001CD96C3D|nr:hypothetical protein [Halomicrobium urmianum]
MGLREKLRNAAGHGRDAASRAGNQARRQLSDLELRQMAAELDSGSGGRSDPPEDEAERMFARAEENASTAAPVDATLVPGRPEQVEHLAAGNGGDGEMESFVHSDGPGFEATSDDNDLDMESFVVSGGDDDREDSDDPMTFDSPFWGGDE